MIASPGTRGRATGRPGARGHGGALGDGHVGEWAGVAASEPDPSRGDESLDGAWSAQSASRGSITPEGTGRTDPLIAYMVISLGRARRPCSDCWNRVKPAEA